MSSHRRGPLKLVNKLAILCSLIVVLTTLLFVCAVLPGVLQVLREQQSLNQAPHATRAAAELGDHLNAAGEMVTSLAAGPEMASGDADAAALWLASALAEHTAYFDGVLLFSPTGDVIAQSADATPPMAADVPDTVRRATTESGAVFAWERGSNGLLQSVWVGARAEGQREGARVLVARLESSFVATALQEAVGNPGVSTAVLCDGTGVVLASSAEGTSISGPVRMGTAQQGDALGGEASMGGAVGYYADVASPATLGWRLAVLGADTRAAVLAQRVLLPSSLAFLAAIVVALSASYAIAERADRPLRLLGRRAHALAVGAPSSRDRTPTNPQVEQLVKALDSIERRLQRVSRVADLIVDAYDERLVLDTVAASIHAMIESADVEVLLVRAGGTLELVAGRGGLAPEVGTTFDLASLPLVDQALASGQPSLAGPVTETAEVLKGLRGGSGAAFALAVPLHVGAEVFGAVLVVRSGGQPLADSEIETVRSFASQASVAVHNAHLFAAERQARREAEVLRTIAENVSSTMSLDESLAAIAHEAGDLFGFERSAVVLRDRDVYGLPTGAEVEGPDWMSAWDAARGEDRVDPAFLTRGELERAGIPAREGVAAALLLPLLRDSAPCGLLVLLTTKVRQPPAKDALELAGTVARQASIAVQKVYLYEQAKRRADNLETIFRISQAVSSSLQDRIVLNRVLDVVLKMLPGDAVMLMTYDPDTDRIVVPMARGIVDQSMVELSLRPGEDVPGRVFLTHEPERYDRIRDADTELLNMAADDGFNSLLVVPLLARGRSVGVLIVLARAESVFSIDEVDLLRTFASQAALAIDTARMFSREHHAATVLRESILPARLPSIEGLEASSVYLPAGVGAEIGGDYYDLFMTPDGRVMLSIGDVCGKGVEAATKTSMLKYSVRGMAAAGLEPARILAELNTMIIESRDPSGIVTLWLGSIDCTSGTLLYANGGHPPAMLLHPEDRRVEGLAPTGPLMGALEGAQWGQRSVAIGAGDTLLLYTDGVTEARSGDGFFGQGRVKRALRGGGGASAVVQRLLDAVQKYSCGRLRDDVAAMALVYRSVPFDAEAVSVARNSGKKTGSVPDGDWPARA